MSDVFWAALGGGAAGGLVAGLISLSIEWFKLHLTRPRLEVIGWAGYIDSQTPVMQFEGLHLILEAINDRNFPMTVNGYGLMTKGRKTKDISLPPNFGFTFPYGVLPGHCLTQFISIHDLTESLREIGCRPSDLKCVRFGTAIGRDFRGPIDKNAMKKLEAEFDTVKQEFGQVASS